MSDSVANRFPVLAPPDARSAPQGLSGLYLAYSLIPLPLGEIAILLLAWALILPR